MAEFEVLLVPVSLILGLGVTRILGSFVAVLRRRRSVDLHWLPLLWAATILFYQLTYFNVLFELEADGSTWTWSIYGSVLFQAAVLFLSAGLVLPSEGQIGSGSMLGDFEEDGRLALVPMALLLGSGPWMNRLQFDSPWVTPGNALNAVLTLVLVLALTARKHRVRSLLGVAFAALSLVGIFMFWAQPGAD